MPYHVVQERNTVFILDCEGETIVSFDSYLPTGTVFPVEVAKIIIGAYEEGASDGESTGYFRCQYQIQKALELVDSEQTVLIEDLDDEDIEYDEDGFEVGYQDRGPTEMFGHE